MSAGPQARGGVLCSGALVYDTLVQPAEDQDWGTTRFVATLETHSGGNGANTSLALAKIGVPVRLLGTVGRDEPGRFITRILGRSGVDTSFVETVDAPTAATVVLVNRAGDRKFLHRPGAGALAFAAPIEFTPERLAGMRHYHMGSLFILPAFRPHAAKTLERARRAGLTTSLDTNWDAKGRWMQDLASCLPLLDYLFVNEDEARMLTGSPDPEAAGATLLEGGVRTVVIKLGARGCLVCPSDCEPLAVPAFDVQVKDTTGAGDCFVAGFLGSLVRRASVPEAARFASAVAALTVQCVGGVAGLEDGFDVAGWMRTAVTRS